MSYTWEPDISFTIAAKSNETSEPGVISGNARMSPPPYQSDSHLEITEAMYKINELMKRWAPDVRFVPAYPDYIIASRGDIPQSLLNSMQSIDNPIISFIETITYKVVRREPAHVGAGGPFGPMKETKPRLREPYIPSEQEVGVSYEMWGQRFENIVQFDCWAKTNYEVDRLIDWFEVFLLLIAGPVKKAGVAEMKYWMRRQDENILKWQSPLNVRSLLYYFTTERLLAVKRTVIDTITVNLAKVHGPVDANI